MFACIFISKFAWESWVTFLLQLYRDVLIIGKSKTVQLSLNLSWNFYHHPSLTSLGRNRNDEKKRNLHWTTIFAEAFALPNKLSALQLYIPASSGLTSFKVIVPLGSTTWRPTGRTEFSLDHVTVGFGFPSAMHFKMAVWLSLTMVSTGGCSTVGAERDWPGSPLAPFTPIGPIGPTGPTAPGSPRSPLTPLGPCGPCSPCLPGGPSGPSLPGGPGLPGNPRLPLLPVFPFLPERQRVSSFAQNWFCKARSSFFTTSFTWDVIWSLLFWDGSVAALICRNEVPFSVLSSPKRNETRDDHLLQVTRLAVALDFSDRLKSRRNIRVSRTCVARGGNFACNLLIVYSVRAISRHWP